MVKGTSEFGVLDVKFAFIQLASAVEKLDLHPDDKLSLRGMIEVKKTVEVERLRDEQELRELGYKKGKR